MVVSRRERGLQLVQFKTYITPDLFARITQFCEKENISKSSIVETTLDEILPSIKIKNYRRKKK